MAALWTGWLLALLLGVRHASEPDHLAAVSTLLAEHPHSRRGALLGAFWGLGHSLALLGVGGVLLALHLRLPGTIADLFELLVAGMLFMLGARSIVRAFAAGRAGTKHVHRHGATQHRHTGSDDHVHIAAWTLGRRPLLIGLMHGLAGSGALTALALASMPTLGSGLVYMLLFGLGSIAGMTLLTGLADLPLRALSTRPPLTMALNAAAGVIALGLGVLWGWPLLLRLTAA